MPKRGFGELEFEILNLLQENGRMTVRQVHQALGGEDKYTTVMTVLRRLADKGLVTQHRGDRAHRYEAVHGRDELVAGLMMDALDQAVDMPDRTAALVHFVESVGSDDLHALQRALVEMEIKQART